MILYILWLFRTIKYLMIAKNILYLLKKETNASHSEPSTSILRIEIMEEEFRWFKSFIVCSNDLNSQSSELLFDIWGSVRGRKNNRRICRERCFENMGTSIENNYLSMCYLIVYVIDVFLAYDIQNIIRWKYTSKEKRISLIHLLFSRQKIIMRIIVT